MSATLPPHHDPALGPDPALDYHAAEGFPTPAAPDKRREWTLVAVGLTALVAVLAAAIALIGLSAGERRRRKRRRDAGAAAPAAAPAAAATTPTLADAKGIAFEPFERVDPTLPAIPPGAVKKFDVDVYQHVTQVSKDLAPTEVWSFAVNGKSTPAPASRRRWSSPRATSSTSRSPTARRRR